MIPPREQWCIQIDVTNACPRKCSNCTRMLSHARQPFLMTPAVFEQACRALADFPGESPADREGRQKVVGIIGGEPLLHPTFPELLEIFERIFPDPKQPGLWTGLKWKSHRYADLIRRVFPQPPAYINPNDHSTPCYHQPVLVAVRDMVPDEDEMWRLINACPLQELWSAAITPKGFFFCEVAAAFDMIFDGPGGLPITEGCWMHDLADYRDQIERWCPRCGVCLPLPGRRDNENTDDVTGSNLEELRRLGSPRVSAGECVVFDPKVLALKHPGNDWNPLRYLRGR